MAQQHEVRGVATSIFTENGTTHVVYRGTAVVSLDADSVTLNTGSWRTVTTKTRMNQASSQYDLGYRVFQKDYLWYVKLPDGRTVPYTGGSTLTFSR